ncbi:hypothetical protein PV326_004000 [Microctonus aethiopoides]|nr:hypothetical protein PV326_004000 [Microctonus aethiopoides]
MIEGFNYQYFGDNHQHQTSSTKSYQRMAGGYDDSYDSTWHLIPPDYISCDDDYRSPKALVEDTTKG